MLTTLSSPTSSSSMAGLDQLARLGMDSGTSDDEAMPLPPATNPSEATNNSDGSGGGGGIRIENCFVFKSRLQEYAQKAGLRNPEYYTSIGGPSHAHIFRSTVIVNNVKYDSLPGFSNHKAAEQSAAEVALMEIVKSLPANEAIPVVHETGLCKNILQQYAQKMNYAIPSYVCSRLDSELDPLICTVEIGGIQYTGAAAGTKKLAEIRAARTALLAIQGQSSGGASGATQYIVLPGKKKDKEPGERRSITLEQLKDKAKKGNQQVVNPEKAEAAGDAPDSNIPPHDSVMQEPPCDIAMEPPKKETGVENNISESEQKGGTGGGARDSSVPLHYALMQEHPYYTAMAQPEEPTAENNGSKCMQIAGATGDTPDSNFLLYHAVRQELQYDNAMVQPKKKPGVKNVGLESEQKSGADGDSDGSNIPRHGTILQEPSFGVAMGQREESRVHDDTLEGEQKVGAVGDANILLHDVVMPELHYDNAMLQHNEKPRAENSGSECKQSGLSVCNGALATNGSFGDK